MRSGHQAVQRRGMHPLRLCFSECPVMGLQVKTAREEINRLIAGKPTRTYCAAVPVVSPATTSAPRLQSCELVLERWHEQYLREGCPARQLLHPQRGTELPHLRDLEDAARKGTHRLLGGPLPAEEVLYPGCNIITPPSSPAPGPGGTGHTWLPRLLLRGDVLPHGPLRGSRKGRPPPLQVFQDLG